MVLLDLSRTDPKTLLGIEEKKGIYVCFNCKVKITEQDFLIVVVNNKSFHTFTNPAGFVYNILTFKQCESYREISFPELKDTWFPGYSWIVINCAKCNSLLGWKYVAADNVPSVFFGLIREQIVLL